MKLEYDKEVDAAYIYLEYPIKPKQVKKTKTITENIFLDIDNNGKVIGIEILNASTLLNKKLLVESKLA